MGRKRGGRRPIPLVETGVEETILKMKRDVEEKTRREKKKKKNKKIERRKWVERRTRDQKKV